MVVSHRSLPHLTFVHPSGWTIHAEPWSWAPHLPERVGRGVPAGADLPDDRLRLQHQPAGGEGTDAAAGALTTYFFCERC